MELPAIFAEIAVPSFIEEVNGSQKKLFEASMNGPTPDVPIQDIFALYRRTKVIVKLFNVFAPE